MEPINGVTPSGLWTFLLIGYGLCLMFITVGSVVRTFKELRKPVADNREDINTMLRQDKERLDMHTDQIKSLRDANKIQFAALIALLDHELHNGNADQMQQARDDLKMYLINM